MLWEAENEERHFQPQAISPLTGHAYGVNCVRYSPFGTIIASASTDGNIILWNSQVGMQGLVGIFPVFRVDYSSSDR